MGAGGIRADAAEVAQPKVGPSAAKNPASLLARLTKLYRMKACSLELMCRIYLIP
jgi:hypothetical protein